MIIHDSQRSIYNPLRKALVKVNHIKYLRNAAKDERVQTVCKERGKVRNRLSGQQAPPLFFLHKTDRNLLFYMRKPLFFLLCRQRTSVLEIHAGQGPTIERLRIPLSRNQDRKKPVFYLSLGPRRT